MTEEEWLRCEDPSSMFTTVKGRKNDRKLRLFAVACCRRIIPLRDDEDSQKALAVAELFADGLALKPQRRNAQHAVVDSHGQSVVVHTLSKVAFDAAFRSSVSAANRVAQVAVRHLGEPEDTLAIYKQAAIRRAERAKELAAQTALLRDIFGNPFRPVALDPAWLTSDVLALARGIYDDRAFDRMPILADALQDAGCANEDVLNHCRSDGPHVRGCWVVDLVLGKA